MQSTAVSYPFGYPELTFVTPVLNANTTLQGNVTMCCLYDFPNPQTQQHPRLVILSESQHTALLDSTTGTPWSVPSEASISGDVFPNYTLNGPARTEVLSIKFTTKETSVYYFIVETSNVYETNVTLYLTYYRNMIVRPWDLPVQFVSGIVSAVSSVITVISLIQTLRTPEEKIQFYPRQLMHFPKTEPLNRSYSV